MSAKLRLATTKDLARLEPMVAAFHGMEGISSDADHRRNALMPLLEGSAHGCVYLIGPDRAPVGYIVLSFGWSVELGGLDGFMFQSLRSISRRMSLTARWRVPHSVRPKNNYGSKVL